MFSYAFLAANVLFLAGNIYVFATLVRALKENQAALVAQTKDFAETITGIAQPWWVKPKGEKKEPMTQAPQNLVDLEDVSDIEFREAIANVQS